MRKLAQILKLFYYHYSLYGFKGISVLLNKPFKKTGLINVKLPGYSHPIYLRNSGTDLPMFYHIYYQKQYDINPHTQPKVIIDCGAHIGLGSIFFANKFPDATIYSVEPEKSNYELLVKNTQPYPNIKCLPYGIWNKCTNLKIIDAGYGSWGFITEEVAQKDENTIEAISIDEIIKRYNLAQIDICKINIEGAEKDLFEKNSEKWLPKTKAMIIELHDRLREGCSKSFFKALVNYNFSLSQSGVYFICILN